MDTIKQQMLLIFVGIMGVVVTFGIKLAGIIKGLILDKIIYWVCLGCYRAVEQIKKTQNMTQEDALNKCIDLARGRLKLYGLEDTDESVFKAHIEKIIGHVNSKRITQVINREIPGDVNQLNSEPSPNIKNEGDGHNGCT